MASAYATSALVMGALAALVLLATVRGRQWYRHASRSPSGERTGWSRGGHRQSRFDGAGLWVAGFVLLALAAVGGVLAFVSNPNAPAELLTGPIAVGAAGAIALYLLLGIYATAKQHGHSDAIAAAETATAFGALFLIAVATQLVGA